MAEKDLIDKEPREEIDDALKPGNGSKITRYALAFISGLVPFVGGAIGGAASVWSEKEQERVNHIFSSWLKLQEDEIREIGQTMYEVMVRLDLEDERIKQRIESPEYLKIVKKCFREWSAAESEDKRVLIRNLLSNAAATEVTSDDVIRMFINWIDIYSEHHFKVVAAIYNHDGITRQGIWQAIDGKQVREDSAEADLFKLLIQELNLGHVIRQHREVDYQGNFIRQSSGRSRGSGSSSSYTSAFDNEKQYELTDLGRQFVHYTMNEIVPRIGSGSPQ